MDEFIKMDYDSGIVTTFEINPIHQYETILISLSLNHKQQVLRFVQAKPTFLNNMEEDSELWKLLVAELNRTDGFTYDESCYADAIRTWKNYIASDESCSTAEDKQLKQILEHINDGMAEPTEDQLKCVFQCLRTNLEPKSLKSKIATRLNILCNTRKNVQIWQKTLERFAKQLMAKNELSNYLEAEYEKSPITLSKIEQRFLKAFNDNGPQHDQKLSTSCRICLTTNSSGLIYLFNQTPNSDGISLMDKLSVCGCFDEEPQIDDDLPQFICGKCSMLVENAYKLRMLCMKTERILESAKRPKDQLLNKLFNVDNQEEEMETEKPKITVIEPIVVPWINIDGTSNISKPIRRTQEEMKRPDSISEKEKHLCEECGKVYKTRSALSEHLASHTDIRPHACKQCGKTFKKRASLQNHRAVHKETKDIKCSECPFTTNTVANLRVHQRTHSDVCAYPCKYCDVKFKTASNQLKHIRSVHQRQRSFQCDQCECSYFSKAGLRRHTVTHTGQRPFYCPVNGCGQHYLWYSGLRKHFHQLHSNGDVEFPTEKFYLDKFFDSPTTE